MMCTNWLIFIGNRVLIQESFGRLSLDIIGVRQEDSGDYQCFVSNAVGDAATQGRLSVIRKYCGSHRYRTVLERISKNFTN